MMRDALRRDMLLYDDYDIGIFSLGFDLRRIRFVRIVGSV